MNRIPRILPLVGIAVGGVLAVKALADVDALPRMFAGARAFAEDAAPKPARQSKPGKAGVSKAAAKDAQGDKDATKDDAKDGAAETTTTAAAPAAATPTPVKVCAPSPAELAKDAGLSPAELQVLQSLGARRTQLDAREGDIDTQLKLLAAAEAKLDAKLQGLNGLKADLQGLLGQTEQKGSAEIDRLVIVYSKMKPKDAAAVMIQLEDKVRLPVAAKLKETQLAAILSQMPPAEAKKLTESLAHRYDKVQQLAQAATATAPAPAAPAAAAAPEADPTAPAPAEKAPAAKPRRARKTSAARQTSASAAATKAVASAAAPKPTVTPASAPVAAPTAPTAAPAATPAAKPAPTASAAPAKPTA